MGGRPLARCGWGAAQETLIHHPGVHWPFACFADLASIGCSLLMLLLNIRSASHCIVRVAAYLSCLVTSMIYCVHAFAC